MRFPGKAPRRRVFACNTREERQRRQGAVGRSNSIAYFGSRALERHPDAEREGLALVAVLGTDREAEIQLDRQGIGEADPEADAGAGLLQVDLEGLGPEHAP